MAGDSDLVGDIGGGAPTATNDSSPNNAGGLLGAVSRAADGTDKVKDDEIELVKRTSNEYAVAREFDKQHREQVGKDRKYAAGLSDPSWASDANLIGSFIDIMTSFLYAQNPDVGVSAAEQVGDQPNKQMTYFAETLELVISNLWRRGGLKKACRKMVRSSLSVSDGWIKALMYTEKRPQPQTEKTVLDKEDQLAQIKARKEAIADGDVTDVEAEELALSEEIAGMKKKLELDTKTGMTIDFVRAEDIQVSLDVADIADYVEADWISNDMYIVRSEVCARFKRITEDDLKSANTYFQRQGANQDKGDTLAAATGEAATEGAYTRQSPGSQGTTLGGSKPVEFVKCVEQWDKRSGMIRTWIDGVYKWAVEPYVPPQASSRFYSFFRLAFYEVDGQRHAQSMSWRLRKLQDEYSACRSNQRLVRERSIPGVLFHAGEVSPDDARKISESVSQEMIGINPTSGAGTPLSNLFAAKPVGQINMELYDTAPIRQDMEVISGVQEALQQATQGSQQPKTATEANIQQTGFQSRTSTDRDTLEEMLTELAQYSAELSIQEVTSLQAQRIAGPLAFWPEGMDVQDLLTMVEVEINAGTTGKPNAAAEKQAWSTILPLLEKSVMQIRQTQGPDPALSTALMNILKETLRRIDDRLDVSEFIAEGPPPPPAGPPPPPPANVSIALKGMLPPVDAVAIGARAAGVPAGPLEGVSGVDIPPHPMPDGSAPPAIGKHPPLPHKPHDSHSGQHTGRPPTMPTLIPHGEPVVGPVIPPTQ
jgi:hypothetical protein